MFDIKTWLNSTEIPFENTSWISPPVYPYGVYLDEKVTHGADDLIAIADHTVSIELYAEFINKESEKACEKIEALFRKEHFAYDDMGFTYIESEKHWQRSYTITYTEKL